MDKAISRVIALFVFVGWSHFANAGIIWDNGTDTTNLGGYCSSCGNLGATTMFDDFTLSSAISNPLLVWDASFSPSTWPTGAVKIGVWSDFNLGLLWSQQFNYSDLNFISLNNENDFFRNHTVSTVLTGLNLTQGSYWLSFSGDNMHFGFAIVGNAGQVTSLNTGGTPSNNGNGLSFRLFSTQTSQVPSPISLNLLGLGIIGLMLTMRRRKQLQK